MCGRYALHASPDVIALQFGIASVPQFRASYNIAPAADVLVVRQAGASLARWGLRGRFANLRAETVLQKFWTSGRCLVPASGFYEWQARGGRKQPYYFFPAEASLFGFAAIWERNAFSLITTDAEGAVRAVHDRMPVIVAKEHYAKWLASEDIPPYTNLRCHPVGMAVNQAANDSAKLIEPVKLAPGLFD
jgi:putative SOS response-associated peptidase YedK